MLKVIFSGSSRYPVLRRRIKKAIEETLRQQKIEGQIELGVTFVGDRKMKQLNKKFMGKKETTDVLSFPLRETVKTLNDEAAEFVDYPDELWRLGDVVVSYPQARRQAQQHNILVDEEIDFLVKHGVLHLLGIHHEE
ncbi:rRNA maturation RNase YbeY [Candidatus Beckwithbacteria bacterium RBG_13_42_9]|uniref:Endoribonuclease YbeY n=1 Tax=Candidatus Beckwithbacteria bacterium RBG_13_42_9 TaxID=1797457 RepID=A0A1F5E6D5_9BACT|nr:MAG: rRNA maturation RNase YbeY [Candidatus Beckwithbacteria bacterium RBG_13_42_9]